MSPYRIILVEGMIGAGKSETAERLARSLRHRGRNASCFHEFAENHPIRTKAVDRLRSESPELQAHVATMPTQSGRYSLDQWSELVDRCRSEDSTAILESTFLQNSVLPLFLNEAPKKSVKRRFGDIVERVRDAPAILVLLEYSDVRSRLEGIHRERGEPWSSWNLRSAADLPWSRHRKLTGLDALVAFYTEWSSIVAELLREYPLPYLRIVDPHLDWSAANLRIEAQLA